MESRLFPRRSTKSIDCLFFLNEDAPPIMRKVINISVGGMLVEKEDNETEINVGNLLKIAIVLDDITIITLSGRIIRDQERSVAVKFSLINKEQEKILKTLCV